MNVIRSFNQSSKDTAIPSYAEIPVPKKYFLDYLRHKYQDPQKSQEDLAIEIAWYVHQGELRRSGEPYFNHVWRVAHPDIYYPFLNIETTEGTIVRGLLHDAIEKKFSNPADNWSEENFRYAGIREEFIRDILYLTKNKGELYFDYSVKLSFNRAAAETKLVDHVDNKHDAKPEKAMMYERSIAYHLAVLNYGQKPGTDIAKFCVEAGMYDHALFSKHYSHPLPQ